MSKLKIGWAGLGNMGTPMVKNLLKAGFPVAVYNRTRSKEQEVLDAGATSAKDLAQLSLESDVILVMVSDDAAAKEIFTGADALLAGDVQGKLFINVSTVSPDTSRYLHEQCRNKGAEFMEAPVSGSVKPAQDGTLIILAAGTEQNYQKAKPLFDALGKLTLLVGPVGAGAAAKLAINYFLGLNLQGLAETVLFAQANGVKTEDMLTIINEGACGSGITKLKSPAIRNNEFPAAFALKHLSKDLRLAKEQGLNTPLSTPLYDSFKQAQDAGLGDEDVMAIYKHLANF
ncbi:NAD(P)-dependent oxidoreductase [Mucilaginibacter sp. Bleaf8]|uniref:NAD(P)-dependent oxidoreductase n=1 Tax=Mucilaginibacter sp. Bleaf8 TaxID=2834430 RepID=UPI001BCD0DC6|nr:NAD(P)-dependent oxidoreductase [Mucilaginibacter sp. Bleaf8]MBS7563483.1 NAD(P)-dependent oxidoreductase [Mucilaginibacter sp. Bleaf8]